MSGNKWESDWESNQNKFYDGACIGKKYKILLEAMLTSNLYRVDI